MYINISSLNRIRKTSSYLLSLIFLLFVFISLYMPVNASTDYFSGELRLDGDGNIVVSDEPTSDSTLVNTLNNLLRRYNNFIVGISGIGALTMLVNFIIQFTKLGACSNPGRRSEIMTGLITSAIATAGLGSVAFIVGFFYSSLN